MNFYLNLLIIILAMIGFLVLYYITSIGDKKEKKNLLDSNQVDLELSEEIIPKTITKKEEYNNEKGEVSSAKNFIRLFNKDPNQLFSYWQIGNKNFYNNKPYLRLINETNNNIEDIEIDHHCTNWYLKGLPNNKYTLLIGYKKNNRFYPLAKATSVTTPLDKPSNIIDEKWLTITEINQYQYYIESDSYTMAKDIANRQKE